MDTTTRSLRTLVDEHRDEILNLARERGASNVRLIGSVARGEEGPDSDIDFVVRFEDGRSLMDLAGLTLDLDRLLTVDVDVISEGGLRPGDEHTFLRGAVRL